MKFTILAGSALLALSLTASAAEAVDAAAAPTTAPAAKPADCLQDTGSRIKRSADQPCVNAAGQVITREQIDRSGATTTAEALRRASPAAH